MDPAPGHSQRHFMANMHSTDTHGQSFSASSPSSNSAITSPMLAPQSPNTQHTMNLINNLLQMQGLDSNSNSSPHSQSSPTIPTQAQSSQILLEHQIKLNQLQQLQQLQQQIFQQQIALISGQSPTMLPSGSPSDALRAHSQMGSIESGGSNNRDSQSFTGLQTPGPSGEIRPQQSYGTNNGLSKYVEPLPRPLLPASPSSMSNLSSQHHRQSSNSSSSIPTMSPHLQRQQQQSMASFSQYNPPLSPSLPRINHPTSPAFHPQRNMHSTSRSMSSSNPYTFDNSSNLQRNMNYPSSNYGHQIPQYLHPGSHTDVSSGSSNSPASAPHSAPEHIAFTIYEDTTGMNSTSPLTPSSFSVHRPNKQRRKSRKADGSNSNSASASPGANEQDMDISPLTSPWLGATPTTTITSNGKSYQSQQKSNKRAASMSGDEGNARKKQSPAIGPTLAMATIRPDVQISDQNMSGTLSNRPPEDSEGNSRQDTDLHNFPNSFSIGTGTDPPRTSKSAATSPQIVPSGSVTSNRGPHHRGSKSTNSTPLLRSTVGGNLATKTRSKSRATATSSAISDTPSPIDLAPDHSSASNLTTTASDVDSRSMPPPPLPSSLSNKGNNDLNTSTANYNPMMDLGNFDISNIGNNFNMGGFMDINIGDMQNRMNQLGDMSMGAGNDRPMDFMNFPPFPDMHGQGSVGNGGMHFEQTQGDGQQRNDSDHVVDAAHQQQSLNQDHNQSHQDMMQMSSQAFPQDPSRSAQQPMTPSAFLNIRRSSRGALGGQGGQESVASQPESNPGPTVTKTRLVQKSTAKTADKEKGATATRGGRSSKKATQASPSLKAILPAGSGTPNMDGSMPGTPSLTGIPSMDGGMSAPAVPLPERKNNHKFAEQKRRDSMKNTFDDLRKLLPPIALPTDPNINLDDPSLLSSPLFHPTVPLLPGALPPRGPPKAGGEGPNKSVSKLQLLICGNEYIRLLKGRVDRRDEEIQKLRAEIQRLRTLYPVSEADDQTDSIDLEKDLDAVERHGHASSKEIAGSDGVEENQRTGASNQAADDAMDEGDDEGDD